MRNTMRTILFDAGHFRLIQIEKNEIVLHMGGIPCGQDWEQLPLVDWDLTCCSKFVSLKGAKIVYDGMVKSLEANFAAWGTNQWTK